MRQLDPEVLLLRAGHSTDPRIQAALAALRSASTPDAYDAAYERLAELLDFGIN